MTAGRVLWRRGLLAAVLAAGCRDVSEFSTGNGSFEGAVVDADFVRTGVAAGTRMCMTLDTAHLQDGPGALSTSDGRFGHAPFRSIPQIWHDPLSTFSFGEGRIRNLLYAVSATTPFGDGGGDDVFAVVSLMQSGDVEVRLLRGAPPSPGAAAVADASADAASGGAPQSVFALFTLSRQSTPCSY